jgi:hypothetical protein
MMNTKPSLLERAAEIYDFASGLPALPANDLPPPRLRPVPKAAPVEAPVQAPVQRPSSGT